MKKLTMAAALTAFPVVSSVACVPGDEADHDRPAAASTEEGPNPTRNAYFEIGRASCRERV